VFGAEADAVNEMLENRRLFSTNASLNFTLKFVGIPAVASAAFSVTIDPATMQATVQTFAIRTIEFSTRECLAKKELEGITSSGREALLHFSCKPDAALSDM
jgi:hypothetical protein